MPLLVCPPVVKAFDHVGIRQSNGAWEMGTLEDIPCPRLGAFVGKNIALSDFIHPV